jgi:hypothetical protein
MKRVMDGEPIVFRWKLEPLRLTQNPLSRSCLCPEKHQIVPAISPDGTTPWPEKFSLEWLEERKRQSGSIIFNAQYQNDTSLMKGHIFREEWFQFYDVEPDWDKMHMFIGCDPAATKREALLNFSPPSGSHHVAVIVSGQVKVL